MRQFGCTIESHIDSIPVSDGKGKEVTLNVKTNYQNGKSFYTDSMGLEEQKRVIDYRPTWNYTVYEPVAGNYYPVNAFMRMVDVNSNRSLAIISDRSQGGSVIREGEMEIMVHRRLLVDDGRGVGEPLNETQEGGKGLAQLVRHNLVWGKEYRTVQKWNDQRILPVFAPTSSASFASVAVREAPVKVPEAVKLNLRAKPDGCYILRLHNMNRLSGVSFHQLRHQWCSPMGGTTASRPWLSTRPSPTGNLNR